MKDATLVLAGAGSGKTSVLIAKARYLIEQGIRRPDEVLLLAFGKDAAKEMSDRIGKASTAQVNAKTFHSLAYGIIAEVEGSVPPLAHHAADEKAYLALIRDLVRELATEAAETIYLLLQWFSAFFQPWNEWDFKNQKEYSDYLENSELRTLQGEKVRSFEELQIANWLYQQGIDYEYEPDYEHPLPKSGRGEYTPDFRLKESGVYIEHFGVRKERQPDGSALLVPAPTIDNPEQYREDMEWKRCVHAKHGTTLIETFSYEKCEDEMEWPASVLRKKLRPHVIFRPRQKSQLLDQLAELGQIDDFSRLLGTFLKHFKGAGLTLADCYRQTRELNTGAREAVFLRIFESIFPAYQSRLGSRIDFEDMITRATEHVGSGRYLSPYRHLLIDEFQDISQGRGKLLKALMAQHDDSRIFAVGDDWQSIYRFSGSDLQLMRDFGQEFGGHFAGVDSVYKAVDLGRTFRSVDRIALPARSFILRNPVQITKKVVPNRTKKQSAIKVFWSEADEDPHSLNLLVGELADAPGGRRAEPVSIALLGRYRLARPRNLDTLKRKYPGVSLHFNTIHASKGTEADHVIILQADAGRFGLPSEIADDPILGLVLPSQEDYQHAEERRVFYVALTRARESVTLLASRSQPSPFVTELLKDDRYDTMVADVPAPFRRCARCGGLMIARPGAGAVLRFICEHAERCGASLPACTACKRDLPGRSRQDPTTSRCSCGLSFRACDECEDGWMIERSGEYGSFLGCVNYPDCRSTMSL